MVLLLRFPRPAESLVLAGQLLDLCSVLSATARAQTDEPILRIEAETLMEWDRVHGILPGHWCRLAQLATGPR
jgi:hypothetical protein